MKKHKKLIVMIVISIIVFQLLFFIPTIQKNGVLADIDTELLEDDFEERYYNHIYSEYENATVTQNDGYLILRPIGVGTTSQLTPTGDTPAHNCVDDVSPDDDTTFVSTFPSDEYDTYETTDHTTETGTISNVRIYIRCKKGDGSSDSASTIIRIGGTDYYDNQTINFSWNDYYTDYAQNPDDSEDWEWTDIDSLELGIELIRTNTVAPRGTQVYANVTYEVGISVGSTTTYQEQDRSIYRAYQGLYSYLHNVPVNYTSYGETITSNSSIIIDFVSLYLFPTSITFWLYPNFFYNISLFIGSEEYFLFNNSEINEWGFIGHSFDRSEYLITNVEADFYIEIYPISNDNSYDTCFLDNLRVRYTNPEPTIDYDNYMGGVEETKSGGSAYNDWVYSNASSSNLYLSTSGENNPDGWLESGTSHSYIYDIWSNSVMSRGVTLNSLWTLKDYVIGDVRTHVMTEINFTIDKDYRITDWMYFDIGVDNDILVQRYLQVYVDDIIVFDQQNATFIGKSYYDNYFEFSYIINFNQLNEKTMQYSSKFFNLFGNSTEYRPLIFNINEEIQSGLNVLSYSQKTRYIAHSGKDSNCIVYQKISRDIHNSPLDDIIDPIDDSTGIGRFFRSIWSKFAAYLSQSEYIQTQLFELEIEAAYYEAIIDQLREIDANSGDWVDTFQDRLEELEETYANGLVKNWRALFNTNDFSGLEDNFMSRWGNQYTEGVRTGSGIFSRLIGGIFGEDVSIVPELIWTFFSNFKNWIVIFFVMYVVMLMRSVMKRDWEGVRREVGFFMNIITYIIKLIQWLIKFVIQILQMIGGFIPFT